MQTKEKRTLLPLAFNYKISFFILLLLIVISFSPSFPGKLSFNGFMEKIFSRASFMFFAEDGFNEFMTFILPRKNNRDSISDLMGVLKIIENNNPRLVIIDKIPDKNNFSHLTSFLRSSALKDITVLCDPGVGYLPDNDLKKMAGYFTISQKENFEVESFVSVKDKPSVSCKVVEIIKGKKPDEHLCRQKTLFYFSDKSVQKIFTFFSDKIDYEKCKNRVILIRTGFSSEFERPFLTMVGVMGSDTFLFNDIRTRMNNNYLFIPEWINRVFFILLSFTFIFLLIRFPLMKGFLLSLIIYELLLSCSCFFYYKFGLTTDWSIVFLLPAVLLFFVMILQLLKFSQLQESLKDYNKLKDDMEFKNKAIASMRKLSELGRLSSTIYHEISHPLQNLTSSLNLLKSEENISEEGNEILDIAVNEVTRLSRLSKGLRRFYQKDNSSLLASINVNELIGYCLKTMELTLEAKEISVELEFAKGLPYTKANPDKFKQLILNLFFNAVDAINKEGWIKVITGKKEEMVEIKIIDSGPGIDDNIRKEIFEAFFSTKGSMGTGLGLYVSYEIVEELGGEIFISPYEKDKGAEFIIYLPVELLK